MVHSPVHKWFPRTILIGVFILSASPLLIVELFPGQLKFVMDPSSYLVFHNIVEFFSIMVSLSMFGMSWYTYEQSKNRHALFLGTAFLAIGLLDFMHTMSMPTMPAFITPNDPQKSVQFWMPVRLFQGIAFLASAYIYSDNPIRWLSKKVLLTSSLLVSALVFIGIIFFQPQMPTLFVSGIGVTPLKKYCEYLVILLLAAATVVYWLRMERTGDRLLGYYLAAFIVSIFSELPLVFYAKPFDTYNVLGHINKIIAFFLIYYGVYRASVKVPYLRLEEVSEKLRNENVERKRMEEALREARDTLEVRVKERTAELAQNNERLQKEIEDRRKAEEAVRESEQRWASTLASIGDAVITTDVTGRVAFMNGIAESLTGWTLREASMKPVAEVFNIVNEETRQKVENPVYKVIARGAIVGLANHTVLVRKDETEVPIDDSGAPIKDKDGKVTGVVLVFRDIIERRRNEETLAAANERTSWLARFPEENPNPVMRVTAEGKVLYCNPAAKRIAAWNCEVGELITQPFLKIFGKALGSGIELQEDFELGGRVFAVSVVPITEECYANIYGRDITKRKEAEKALRESEQRFSALYSSMTEGVAQHEVIHDSTGHPIDYIIRDVNPAFEAITGLSKDKVVGERASEIYGTGEAPYLDLYSGVASSGQAKSFETYFPPMDKHFSISVFSPAKGRFATVFRDITERKRAEEGLRKAKDELEIRVQERTEELAKSQQRLQLLASQLLLAQEKERKRVAVELHDGLLSELAATKFLLEGKLALLGKGKLSDLGEFKRVGDVLAIAIKEARRIMNNLHPSVLDELGLIAAMNWSCGEYQKSYPHIKVETKIAVSEGDISESIRVVIYRVLQEALNNFARHGKGDRVELSLAKTDRTLVLIIRDNGQGFDVETVQRGLGLESMRERVELSGGQFKIESIIGQGTTIRATWASA